MYKVGDKVKVKNYNGIIPYNTIKIGNIGVIDEVLSFGYRIYFKRKDITLYFQEENIKKVGTKND